MHHFAYRNGVLRAEAVDLVELAQSVGTPFYCYSTATLRRHYEVFAGAFADVDALIARGRTMKRLLLRGIECGCVEIDACPIVAERRSAMLGSRRRERMKRGLPLHSVAVR